MGLNGDLCSDIVGTSPVYPKIVDQSWLDVDLSKYDNYPSDNQPLRIVPKLHDLWSHGAAQTGVNLVPNATVMPLGVRSSEEDAHAVDQIIKEAKKIAMSGLKGKSFSNHLRARFSSKHIAMAQEALKKVAEEVGLLGNVYIDASAFNSYDDAEKFLSQHRNRLARDILLQADGLNPSVVSMLANAFHKNVVSSIEYNETILKKYRDHLVQAKRIPDDMVIASKEDLRKAFLYEKPQEVVEASEAPVERVSGDQLKQATEQMFHNQSVAACEANDSIKLHKISPIVSFVQSNLSKGKTSGAIKEMVKAKFAMTDIQDAAEALAITLSKEGLSYAHVDTLVKEGKISMVLGSELKKIGCNFPIKETPKFEGAVEVEKQSGLQGYMYSLDGKRTADQYESIRKAAAEALKKGYDLNRIRAKMLEKVSAETADQVLSEAVILNNAIPAGVVANKIKKAPKVAVEEPAPKQTLPDPSTIASQLREFETTFEGSMMNEIDIDPARSYETVEVTGLFNREGIDKTIA
jgi:hypothetical protein